MRARNAVHRSLDIGTPWTYSTGLGLSPAPGARRQNTGMPAICSLCSLIALGSLTRGEDIPARSNLRPLAGGYLASDEWFHDPAHADDAEYLRWICVIGLAFATSKGFALLP